MRYRRRRRKAYAFPTEVILGFTVIGLLLLLFPQFLRSEEFTTFFPYIGITLAVFAAVVAAVTLWVLNRRRVRRLRALQLSQVDAMDGVVFERYVGEILKTAGFSVQFTVSSNDFGVDILATKNGKKYAVQLKRYKDAIGSHAIMEVVAGMQHYACERAIVVTNSTFTPSARKLAESTNCLLIGREQLSQMILDFQSKKPIEYLTW